MEWYAGYLIKRAMGPSFQDRVNRLSQQAVAQQDARAAMRSAAPGAPRLGGRGWKLGLGAAGVGLAGYLGYKGLQAVNNMMGGVQNHANQTNQAIDSALGGR